MEERGHYEQPRSTEQNNNNAGVASELNTLQPLPTPNTSSETDQRTLITEKRTSSRGFAAMDSDKQKRIAREGGRAAHRQGVAHEWDHNEAREAGRKGGQMVSRNREHMSEIGRKGGQNSGQRRQRSEEQ